MIRKSSILIGIFLILIEYISSVIIVKSPKDLAQKFTNGTIKTSLSNFGRIPYGYNLVGRVIFNPDNLETDYACKQLPFVGEDFPVDESPIVLVHRGSCTFVTKVRNVENAGGHVALIIDNVNENIDRVVMADDGRGRELTIPGVLISQQDGQILADYFTNNRRKDIVLEVKFEMEQSSNKVNYDLFTTADNDAVYKLLNEFIYYQNELWENIKMTVHYITYQHPQYDAENLTRNSPKENCLGNGKYCATPGKFGTVDGREIVHQAIIQKCIYNWSYADPSTESKYWNYISTFYNMCLNSTIPNFSRECSAQVMITIGVPQTDINKCIHDSFIASSDAERSISDFELKAENSLLNADNEDRRTYLLSFIPSITINGRTFWGNWRADNLFEAICAGFNKKPEVCYNEGAFKRPSKLSWFSVFVIILVIIAINVFILYLCKNYIRKRIVERIESTDINHKINTVVTSYLALRDNK